LDQLPGWARRGKRIVEHRQKTPSPPGGAGEVKGFGKKSYEKLKRT